MLSLPFVLFWILVFVARSELGIKWMLILIAMWVGLLMGFISLGLPSYLFVVPQALLDAILIIVIFGGDIRIR